MPSSKLANIGATISYTFHMLGVPHTISVPEYTSCAFTQKILKICKLLKSRGHRVIHYGHEDSRVVCDENVAILSKDDFEKAYGDHDWRTKSIPNYSLDDHVYRTFYANAISELHRRKRRGDILLCPWGHGHKPVADALPDMIACEPGIGYPGGGFAKFRVFESYAVMHAYLGQAVVASMSNSTWYDVVIPNCFELDDFAFSAEKDDYFLFLGRIGAGKGTHIAMQIVEEIGGRLIVAGSGTLEGIEGRTSKPKSDYVEFVGLAGVEERKQLMSRARATIAASTFLEPFCGVQIESMLSGTPVISTDWGAFAEYNIHGLTGYRCRTFEQFVWAARNIGKINPHACRDWAAQNFSLDRVADMYDEYFYSVQNVISGQGWYEPNPARQSLDWLTRRMPQARATAKVKRGR